ncbi:MAG: hypothetical protein ACOYMK_02720 [Hyphomonadaceae bacterium]|jgi:hypothetical protein
MTIRTLAYGGLVLSLTALLAACGSQQRETTPVPATLATAEPAPPSASSPPPGVPPLPTDLLGAGSQQARDELYCSALIYAENPDLSDALAPVDEAQLRKRQALGFIIGESGINRLVTEKAIHATQARTIADAYAAQVDKDLKAKAPRISLDACNTRARAIPMPE